MKAPESSETSEHCSTHQKTAEFTITNVQTSKHTCLHLSLPGVGKLRNKTQLSNSCVSVLQKLLNSYLAILHE